MTEKETVYRSTVHVEKFEGALRTARIEPFEDPLTFGVHGAIAEHYDAGTREPIPTTLDHVVAATGG